MINVVIHCGKYCNDYFKCAEKDYDGELNVVSSHKICYRGVFAWTRPSVRRVHSSLNMRTSKVEYWTITSSYWASTVDACALKNTK